MTYKPISTLPETILEGRTCPICRHASLTIVHVSGFPDYIECSQCNSAYVLAVDKEHILFGKINPSYPETSEAALKQWILEDAVRRVAQLERSERFSHSAVESPKPKTDQRAFDSDLPVAHEGSELPDAAPELPEHMQAASKPFTSQPVAVKEQAESAGHSRFSALWREEPLPEPAVLLQKAARDKKAAGPAPGSARVPSRTDAPLHPPEPNKGTERTPASSLERSPVFVHYTGEEAPEVLPDEPPAAPEKEDIRPQVQPGVHEPEPGKRFRVVLSGSQVNFPYKVCSHCLNSPASSSLAMTAFIPDPEQDDMRVPTQIRIPLCTSCRKRASARSELEQKERSKAFIYSSGSSLLLILILVLSGGLSRTAASSTFLSVFLVLVTATIGFSIPLLVLLERSGKLPPPEDALFVLSTLYMPGTAPQDLTMFDWRSRGYAELFHLANRSSTVKTVHEVEDQGPQISHREPVEMVMEKGTDSAQ